MQQGTGNINYSLNKNDFYKILTGASLYFIPFYYILVIISLLYIFTIRFKEFYFSNRNNKYKKDEDIEHFFRSITYNTPFNILSINYQNKNENKYVGLSNTSYFLIITSYVITLLIILEGLIKSFLYSIYVNIIQVNSNNNPYNNPNCVSKISDNPYTSTIINYTMVMSLSLVFLVPFLIPYLIKILHFDNYNIKHNKWFSYILVLLIFFPLITVLISRTTFNQKLSIFPNLYKFVETKDYDFLNFISNNIKFKIYTILPFLLILFIYCYYTVVYAQFKNTFKHTLFVFAFLFFIIFIFIPFFILFFGFGLLFNNKDNTNETNNIIENIQNNGVSNLYDLLVKYNYPCFMK